MNTIGSLKTAVLDYWKGAVELEALDDVLPCIIYVVSRSHSKELASEVYLMMDFIRNNPKFEVE